MGGLLLGHQNSGGNTGPSTLGRPEEGIMVDLGTVAGNVGVTLTDRRAMLRLASGDLLSHPVPGLFPVVGASRVLLLPDALADSMSLVQQHASNSCVVMASAQ